MSNGYIKIWRKIKRHPFWQQKRKFSRFEAWIDLVMSANGIDKTVNFRDEFIPLKRGSFITSERTLAENWNWSRDRVRKFLNLCVKEDMIRLQKQYQRYTIITILKYRFYNPMATTDQTTEKPQTRPQTRPQTDITNKDKEKEMKGNEIKPLFLSRKFSEIDINLTQFLIDKILENDPKSKVANLTIKQQEDWLNQCRLLRERDKRTPEEIYKVIKFSQEDNFWKSVILSMPKLREKFSQLWLKAKNTKLSGIIEWLEEKEKEKDPF